MRFSFSSRKFKAIGATLLSMVLVAAFQNCSGSLQPADSQMGSFSPDNLSNAPVRSEGSCSFNGLEVASGSAVPAYATSHVPVGQTCATEFRACDSGNLTGSYNYSACTVDTAAGAACAFAGAPVASGASVTAYLSSSVAAGQSCTSQTRTCTNGALSGSYNFSNCSVSTIAASCTVGVTSSGAPNVAAICKASMTVPAAGRVEFYRNYDVSTPNSSITKLTLMVHGQDRNYDAAFARMLKVYTDAGTARSTLIVAPHFLADLDSPAAGYLYWSDKGWPNGDDSLGGNPVSSYDVMDAFVSGIIGSGNFPNLREVVVAGFSAGGRFTQHYAAATSIDASFPQIHFRYLVASATSFMYFDTNRLNVQTHSGFTTPSHPGCNAFNNYPYGLTNQNRYGNHKSPAQTTADFEARDVVLLVGDQDDATAVPNPPIANDPKNAAELDVGCSAEFQGASRLQRSQVFKAYMDTIAPQKYHPLIIVPGVAHKLEIYSAPSAQSWL